MKQPNCYIELVVLEDITFEYEPFEAELTDFFIDLPTFDLELPAFEPLLIYEFYYRASSITVCIDKPPLYLTPLILKNP